MDFKLIKDLMNAMGKAGIKRLRLKKNGDEIELERDLGDEEKSPFIVSASDSVQKLTDVYHQTKGVKSKTSDIPTSLHPPLESLEAAEKETPTAKFITSPMVGTYYASAGPEEPQFIKVGDTVTENTVVCIIEAMKVMNEIKAQQTGVVTEILVENNHPVEFGTKLFKIQ